MYVFKVLFWGLLLTLPLHTYAQDELKNPREVIASIPISGNTVDITGHANHLNVYGGEFTLDRFENQDEAILLDGFNDWGSIRYSKSLAQQGEITMSIWAKGASSTSNFTSLIGRTSFQNEVRGMDPIGISINDGSVIHIFVAGEQFVLDEYLSVDLDNDNWNHYAMSYKPGEYVSLFVNGKLVRKFETDIPQILRESQNDLIIGALSKAEVFGRTFFQGAIDEILVVQRALTHTEIKEIYSKGGWGAGAQDPILDPSYEHLVAYYPFNGNADDESGNLNDARVIDARLSSDRFGNPVSSYFFDGEGDYLEIAHSKELSSDSKTISFWFKKESNEIEISSPGYHLESLLYKAFDTSYLREYSFIISSSSSPFHLLYQTGNETDNSLAQLRLNDSIEAFEWYHIVGIIDSTGYNALYINGTLTDESYTNFEPVKNNAPIVIGKASSSSSRARYFLGKIDDIRIYNEVLNLDNILSLYNEPGFLENSISEFNTSTDDEMEDQLRNIRLYQNYPNPFNPSTTIQFSLQIQSLVKLEVFDIKGHLIETIVESQLPMGIHSYTFDGSNIASGIYFYKLTTDDQSIIKKLTLVK
ncbi:MAG: T9SS type A sorting domain-containing protein [Balneolaceae bacterium]|nr:T9SS type A sorting domain-containing protein [Balneolaceae bacterium]